MAQQKIQEIVDWFQTGAGNQRLLKCNEVLLQFHINLIKFRKALLAWETNVNIAKAGENLIAPFSGGRNSLTKHIEGLFKSKQPIPERLGIAGLLVSYDKLLRRPQVVLTSDRNRVNKTTAVNFACPSWHYWTQHAIGRWSSIISLTFGLCRTQGPESPCPINLVKSFGRTNTIKRCA